MPVRLGLRPAPELIVTILPQPFAVIIGTICRVRKNTESKLAAKISRQSCSETSVMGLPVCPQTPPAAETKISMAPTFERKFSIKLTTLLSLPRSAPIATKPRSDEVLSRSSPGKSVIITRTPFVESSAAMAFPIPPRTPVTRATRFVIT